MGKSNTATAPAPVKGPGKILPKSKTTETTMDFLGELEQDLAVGGGSQYAKWSDFQRDPEQPRKKFDPVKLKQLGAGMKSEGVLQALLVRDNDTGVGPRFIIVDGERRWRAAELEGIESLPYLVRNDIDRKRLRFAQAVANANREDLSDYELAVVIQEMLDEDPKLKKGDIADQLGKDPAVVSRLLALLDPEYVELAQEGMIESASTLSHFKRLDEAAQATLLAGAKESGEVITRERVEAFRAPVAIVPAGDGSAGEAGGGGAGSGQVDGAGQAGADSGGEGGGALAAAKPKGGGAAVASKSVKLLVNVETVERLIPFFVDKETTKVELKISQDEAAGLLEKLGKPVPDDVSEYAAVIKAAME